MAPARPLARCAVQFPVLLLLCAAWSAQALAATARYTASSNRIYVEGGGSITLTQIKAALPSAPLTLVDAATGVWWLGANLQIEDGSTVQLHGPALDGDVSELRLHSEPGGFVQITADHGALDIRATHVTSWDRTTGAPDRNVDDGRAFIRVRSRLHADGQTALESRMDVIDSQIAYLGYAASESYGLVWKVLGSPDTVPDLYDRVQVRGDIRDSYIHHNYFGVYTYGHEAGQWTGNEVAHNVQYGIDPHDDSDRLLIADNYVHHNGNHGIIASKRCNHVVIRNNRSWDNVGNGVMLHRSSDDALVEGNDLRRNTDAGVAVFGSSRVTVRDNLMLQNGKAGVRLSMGAADTLVENNNIGFGGQYGLYFYRGSDVPEPGDDGRPKRNVFSGNLVRDHAGDAVRMSDSDETRFIDNRFVRNGDTLYVARSRDSEWIGNELPRTATLRLDGDAQVPTHAYVETQPFLRLAFTGSASARFGDAGHAVFDVSQSVASLADPARSVMDLSPANVGAGTTVYTRDLRAVPSGATVEVKVTQWQTSGARNKSWQARTGAGGTRVDYRVGELAPGQAYAVTEAGTSVGRFTADAQGRIGFSRTPAGGSWRTYVVTPE